VSENTPCQDVIAGIVKTGPSARGRLGALAASTAAQHPMPQQAPLAPQLWQPHDKGVPLNLDPTIA
jgi:hypothetical protein